MIASLEGEGKREEAIAQEYETWKPHIFMTDVVPLQTTRPLPQEGG